MAVLSIPRRIKSSRFFSFVANLTLWRAFLYSTLLLVLAFAAWARVFSYFHDEPAQASSSARLIVNVVNLTRTALINVDEGRRNDMLIALTTLEKIHVYPGEPTDEILPLTDNRMMRLIVEEVRASLGKDIRFARRWKTLGGFWVNFRLEHRYSARHDEYWVMLPLEYIQYSPIAWLSWGTPALLVAILGVYLMVYRVSMPLRRLADTVRKVGKGETSIHFEEEGPEEIVVVARALNQMAESLARAADDRALLLAGVSHDLRTPLARLRLEVELANPSGTDDNPMIADIETMDYIIGQFLDYGRGERGSMEPVDIAVLITDIVTPYRMRGVQIEVEMPPHMPLLAQPLPLRRALINLIDNAMKYAGEDKPLDVRVFSEDQHACIEVADRGPGIPPSRMDRMRQPFTRQEESRSGTRGAGLGLAIVDRIAQAHDGQFDLLPREGGGLRAIVRLPAPPESLPPFDAVKSFISGSRRTNSV